jgi:hypothetical protein
VQEQEANHYKKMAQELAEKAEKYEIMVEELEGTIEEKDAKI